MKENIAPSCTITGLLRSYLLNPALGKQAQKLLTSERTTLKVKVVEK